MIWARLAERQGRVIFCRPEAGTTVGQTLTVCRKYAILFEVYFLHIIFNLFAMINTTDFQELEISLPGDWLRKDNGDRALVA